VISDSDQLFSLALDAVDVAVVVAVATLEPEAAADLDLSGLVGDGVCSEVEVEATTDEDEDTIASDNAVRGDALDLECLWVLVSEPALGVGLSVLDSSGSVAAVGEG
jgi:hypothetical protein